VLPMPRGAEAKAFPPKGYTGRNGVYPPESQVDRWVRTRGDYNISIRMPEGVLGIDVDAYDGKPGAETLAALVEELGPWTGPEAIFPVRSTSRDDGVSGIYLFRAQLPDGHRWRGELGPGVELVHAGHRYAMAAPSIHPGSGQRYRWLVDGSDEPVRLPEPALLPELATAWVAYACRPALIRILPDDTSPKYQAGHGGTPYGLRALDAELATLRRVWDDDAEAWNPYLNRASFAVGQLVAGGELEDGHARGELDSLMAELAAPASQQRTLDSGYNSGKSDPRRAPDPPERPKHRMSAGGLESDGHSLVLPTRVEDKKRKTVELVRTRWSDFNITALGRVLDQDGALQAYSVRIDRDRDGVSFDALLPVKTLARAVDLQRWLMSYEVSVLGTDGPAPAWNVRLQMFLADQQSPAARTASHLGWDDETQQFLTFEGAVSENGLSDFGVVRPDPDLRKRSIVYHYGFEHTPEVARHVLRQVLTFHDSTVTSVFGSWWAACLLKGHIMSKVSMFPVMAIEASSESGKTNGFFPFMIALAGNQRGQSNDTAASFRDIVAGHRNGIAWQDDLDDPKRLFEIIRAATSEGVAGKKSEDKTSTVDAKLVAPIMISGEGLEVSKQKAMADRTILLTVPSPRSRRSLIDPSRAQWDDIVELRETYPDLSVLAGHLVVDALSHADAVEDLALLRGGESGRHADKLAVLRAGARVLALMTGDGHHIDVVDRWSAVAEDVGNENALTLSLVPEYLRLVGAVGNPERRTFAPHHSVPTPVLVRPDSAGNTGVWVSTGLLAQWWKEHRNGRVELRTETANALRSQATDLGMKGERSGKSGVDYVRLRVREADEHTGRAEMRTWGKLPQDITDRLLSEFDQADPPNPAVDIVTTSGGYRLSTGAVARLRDAQSRSRPS